MDIVATVAAIAAAFIGGGGIGALFAARISGRSTENAATISAAAARATADLGAAEARWSWLNSSSRELVDRLFVLSDRHYKQLGSQRRRRQEVARGLGEASSIPAIDGWLDETREAFWRLSLIADAAVVAAAKDLYNANLAADEFAYDPARHLDGRRVVPLSPLEEAAAILSLHAIQHARDSFRNAYRGQLGQAPLTEPDPFAADEGQGDQRDAAGPAAAGEEAAPPPAGKGLAGGLFRRIGSS